MSQSDSSVDLDFKVFDDSRYQTSSEEGMMTNLFCVVHMVRNATQGKRRKIATNLIKQIEFLIQQHADDYKKACKVHRSDGSAASQIYPSCTSEDANLH